MSKHNRVHPGVQVYLKDSIFCVRFKQNGREKRKSLSTTDSVIADSHAVWMYRILRGEEYNFADVPATVKRVLDLTPPEFKDIHEISKKIDPFLEDVDLDDERQVNTLNQIIDDSQELIDTKRDHNKDRDELEAVKNRNAYLEAMLVAAGKAHLAKMKPKTLKIAVESYLENGTTATARTKKEYKHYLNEVRDKIGPEKLLHQIEEDSYIDFLQALKNREVTPQQVRKISNILIAMLQNQSGGLYPVQRLKEWRKLHTGSTTKTDSDFFWLTKQQAVLLAKAAKKQFCEYWHDAILVQFTLGLRPEELPLLQSQNVTSKKGAPVSIHVAPLRDSSNTVIRRLKTVRSAATLSITHSVKSVIKRRLKQDSIVLFPRSTKELGLKEQPRRRITSFEFQNQIWTAMGFCKHYIHVLRESAKSIGIESTRVDCRTLRRSRGRDIILKTKSSEQAAAFLRDNPVTVARFYCRWLPGDVNVV
jgi:hypothetical protein